MRLAACGYRIAAVDVDDDAARSTAAMIAATGEKSHAYRVDVSRAAEAMDVTASAERELGDVDVVVNSAGILRMGDRKSVV